MAYILQKGEKSYKIALNAIDPYFDTAYLNSEFIIEISHGQAEELLQALKDRE